jgi:hypothetical protein
MAAATQVIWLRADTTSYCEQCEECSRDRALPPTEATLIQGSLRPEADVGFTTCRRGHRVRVRRVARVRPARELVPV